MNRATAKVPDATLLTAGSDSVPCSYKALGPRACYHNPATGRCWTADAFEGFATDPASLRHYTINQNDPVNRFDPSGHISISEGMMATTIAPMVRGPIV